MNIAMNFEMLGSCCAKTASNMSISDLYDEFGNLTHHIYTDGSILDVQKFEEVSEESAGC